MSASTMKVAEAAKLMGVSQQFVRVSMQRGKLPIGSAVKLSGNRWTYYISAALFEQFTGIKREPPAATDSSQKTALCKNTEQKGQM